MVDGNLMESTPVPFPPSETLYIVVGTDEGELGELHASSYVNSLLAILTRYDEQQARLPHHRRILVSDSSSVFNPFMNDDDATNVRFTGFVQTLSFLTLGNPHTLVQILRHCIVLYIRMSVCIDLTTSDEEEVPPSNES